MKYVYLDNDTRTWIMDRVLNGEPLRWKVFLQIVRTLDIPFRRLKKYYTNEYALEVNAAYKECVRILKRTSPEYAAYMLKLRYHDYPQIVENGRIVMYGERR